MSDNFYSNFALGHLKKLKELGKRHGYVNKSSKQRRLKRKRITGGKIHLKMLLLRKLKAFSFNAVRDGEKNKMRSKKMSWIMSLTKWAKFHFRRVKNSLESFSWRQKKHSSLWWIPNSMTFMNSANFFKWKRVKSFFFLRKMITEILNTKSSLIPISSQLIESST